MEKNELITKYELVLIIDANLTSEQKETIFKEAANSVTNSGAKVVKSQVWLEKQKFTFDIKKCKEGTYYLIHWEGPRSSVENIRSSLKLNEKILRFATCKVETHAAFETVSS